MAAAGLAWSHFMLGWPLGRVSTLQYSPVALLLQITLSPTLITLLTPPGLYGMYCCEGEEPVAVVFEQSMKLAADVMAQ